MLKVKENKLKELVNYGFAMCEDNWRGHKYSWKREFGNGYYELYVARDNRLSFYSEAYATFGSLTIRNKMQDKLYDLINDGIVEKINEDGN